MEDPDNLTASMEIVRNATRYDVEDLQSRAGNTPNYANNVNSEALRRGSAARMARTGDPLINIPTKKERPGRAPENELEFFLRRCGVHIADDHKAEKDNDSEDEGKEGKSDKTSSGPSSEAFKTADPEKRLELERAILPPEVALKLALGDVWVHVLDACKRIINTTCFKFFFDGLILTNMVFMGLRVEGVFDNSVAYSIDAAYALAFVFEIVMRILGSEGAFWRNSFLVTDTVIVILNLCDTFILPLVGGDIGAVSALRVMRIIRLLRARRLLSWVRPLRVLLKTTTRAMSSFFWTVVLLFVLTYGFALAIRVLLGRNMAHGIPTNILGTMPATMRTLMDAFFGGLSWAEAIFDPLMKDSETRTAGVVVFVFALVVKFFWYHLTVSVFIENLLAAGREDSRDARLEQVTQELQLPLLKKLLKAVDLDDNGMIRWNEIASGMKEGSPYYQEGFKALSITPEEVECIFALLDGAENGEVSIESFLLGYLKFKGSERSLSTITREYQMKEVLKILKRPDEGAKSLMKGPLQRCETVVERSIHTVDRLRQRMERQAKSLKDRLESLERRTDEVRLSLEVADVDGRAAEGAPLELCLAKAPGGAGVCSMVLCAEMAALREAAEAWLQHGAHDAGSGAVAVGAGVGGISGDEGFAL